MSLSANNSSASVPGSVTVAAGSSSATFSIGTTPVTADTSVTVTASLGGSKTAALMIKAPCTSGLSLSLKVTGLLTGNVLTAGASLTGPAPAGGRNISLVSVGSSIGSVYVPAGQTSATATINNPGVVAGSVVQGLLGSCAPVTATVSLGL